MIFIRLYFAILKYMNKLFLYICIIGSVKQLQECRRDWLGNSKQQVNILPSRKRDSGAVVTYILDTKTAFDWLDYYIQDQIDVKPKAALRCVSQLYISKFSCILYNCQLAS